MRIPVSIFFIASLLFACKRDDKSYMNFDAVGEEAQKAIATDVDFTLNDDIFQRWQKAQSNLEKLPPNELANAPDPGGADPVARGVRRLETSTSARRAIESTGLTVRQFVFATVALAQAMKASQAGVPPTVGAIAANVRFVMGHAGMSNRGAASVWVPPSELSPEELAAQRAMQVDTAIGADIATGAEQAQPSVPQLNDWTRNDNSARDTSSRQSTTPAPPAPSPKTDSLPSLIQ